MGFEAPVMFLTFIFSSWPLAGPSLHLFTFPQSPAHLSVFTYALPSDLNAFPFPVISLPSLSVENY
jgi:hypothetical protein